MSVPDLHARSKIKRSHGTPWRLLWEGGKKNRIPFLPSQVRSQICLCNTFKVQSVGTCHLRNQNRESEHRVRHTQWEKWRRFEKPGLGRPGSGPDLVGLLFPPLLSKRESVYSAVLGAPSEIHIWKEVSGACFILMSFVFILLTDSKGLGHIFNELGMLWSLSWITISKHYILIFF